MSELCTWALIFISAFFALHYGSPAGHQEHPSAVTANARAFKIVFFTLLSLGFMVRMVVHNG